MKLLNKKGFLKNNDSYDLFVIKYIVHFAILISLIRAVMFAVAKDYLYSFFIFIFLIVLFVMLFLLKKGELLKAKILLIIGFVVISLAIFYFRGIDMLPWLILTPVGAIVLVGLRLGVIVSLIYFFLMISIFYLRTKYFASHVNLNMLLVESITVYFAALVFGALYELIRISRMERLKYFSNHDPLTGIANRRFFYQHGVIELEKSKRFKQNLSVLMLDLDDFKKLNDKYGHAKGDDILIRFCLIVKKFVRKSDIFARIGGEEFVIMLYNVNKDSALLLGEKILKAVETANFDMPETLTVSIGCAERKENDTLDSLLKRADDALYEAKNKGKNRCEFL
jgi:diguanylate cyclase (GGDEF)-like protein